MATDYDTPRKTDDDLNEDSIEELKARRNEKSSSVVDVDDFDSAEGQTISQVQTAADSWRYYGFQKGDVGKLGLCRGGSGQR